MKITDKMLADLEEHFTNVDENKLLSDLIDCGYAPVSSVDYHSNISFEMSECSSAMPFGDICFDLPDNFVQVSDFQPDPIAA